MIWLFKTNKMIWFLQLTEEELSSLTTSHLFATLISLFWNRSLLFCPFVHTISHPELIHRIFLAMLNSPDQVELPLQLSAIISKKDIRSVKCISMYMIPPGSL